MAGTEKVPEPSHPDGEHREVFFQHSLGLSPVLFSACPQRHSQDQCSGEAMGRKPLGATASTVLSSSLEFIPRSFKPKGGGGTTVKIVLKEKHKKGKGRRGRVLCPLPEMTSPGLGTPGKLFQQQFSTTGCHQTPPQPTSLSHLQPGGPAPVPQPGRIPNHRSRGSSVLGVFWRPWDLGREMGSWKTSRGPSSPPAAVGQGGPPCTYLPWGWSVLGPLSSPWRGEQKIKMGRQLHGDKGEKGRFLLPLGALPPLCLQKGSFQPLEMKPWRKALGPPKICMEKSAGGTLCCAWGWRWPWRDPGLPEARRQVRSCPQLPLTSPGVLGPIHLHLLEPRPLLLGHLLVGVAATSPRPPCPGCAAGGLRNLGCCKRWRAPAGPGRAKRRRICFQGFQALLFVSSSLRLQREDLLPRGSVAPCLQALRPPALHPVHVQGRCPGLPEDLVPQGVSLRLPRESGREML